MSKPHTCPTCGGTGQRQVIYTVYTRCESCKGAGIVWEPTTTSNGRPSSIAGPV